MMIMMVWTRKKLVLGQSMIMMDGFATAVWPLAMTDYQWDVSTVVMPVMIVVMTVTGIAIRKSDSMRTRDELDDQRQQRPWSHSWLNVVFHSWVGCSYLLFVVVLVQLEWVEHWMRILTHHKSNHQPKLNIEEKRFWWHSSVAAAPETIFLTGSPAKTSTCCCLLFAVSDAAVRGAIALMMHVLCNALKCQNWWCMFFGVNN